MNQSITLPKGPATVYAVLTRKNIFDRPLVSVSVFVGKNKIAAKVIRSEDWGTFLTQRFGLIVTSPKARKAIVNIRRVSGDLPEFTRTRVDRSLAPANLYTPWLGDAARPLQWSVRRRPSAIRTVWIDPRFADVLVYGADSQHSCIQFALHCFGRVCGLAFRPTRYVDASVRFHSGTSAQVTSYSQSWNMYDWGIAPWGSAYLAIHPNRRDVWFGDRLKPVFGGGLLSQVNATRFCLNAYCQILGFGFYHDDRAWPWAAADSNFSYEILFPDNNHGDEFGGLAGMDRYEISQLQARFGVPWLGIHA